MTQNLRSTIFIIVLTLSSLQALPQIVAFDTISFDSPTDKIVIQATPENIWQIGSPDKVFFDGAYSGNNAIVTDTVNSYPPNNVSSFIYTIHNALTQDCYTSMQFWHKYDTDSLNDIASLEASYDGGVSWIPLKDTIVYSDMEIMLWWDWDYHEATNQSTQHNNLITGRSDGWIRSTFNWQWYLAVSRDTIIGNPDSLMIKFTFTSDEIAEQREGWMIDQIFTSSGYWGGCGASKYTDYEKFIELYPNPFKDVATIKLKESVENGVISLYDAYGRLVHKESNVSGTETKIYKNELNPGLYFLQITTEGKLLGARRIIISD